MATIPQSLPEFAWFREFFKEELEPYPGRFETGARMVLAATLIMVICMTFRIPNGYLGASLALIISHENTRTTLESSGTILLASGIGAAYRLTSVWVVISAPPLHFLWMIGSFFVAFYALSTMTNYFAAVRFGVMIALRFPLRDSQVPANPTS